MSRSRLRDMATGYTIRLYLALQRNHSRILCTTDTHAYSSELSLIHFHRARSRTLVAPRRDFARVFNAFAYPRIADSESVNTVAPSATFPFVLFRNLVAFPFFSRTNNDTSDYDASRRCARPKIFNLADQSGRCGRKLKCVHFVR